MAYTRLGLLGDIHSESRHLEAALKFLAATRVEDTICVGDVVDGGSNANRCCHLLQDSGVFVVRGNHDRWLLKNQMRTLPDATALHDLDHKARAFLEGLPPTLAFETTNGLLLLCHGVGENDMRRLTPDDEGYALECNTELQALVRAKRYRYVVGGHTHRRMLRTFNELTFINPGTLFDSHQPCLAIADFSLGQVTFYDIIKGEVHPTGKQLRFGDERFELKEP